MLPSLLRRDLTLHRRVLVTASLLPFLFMALVVTAQGPVAQGMAALLWILGLLLVAVLPHSLHLREERLGTLPGLLVLPVHRRQLVRLRFLEGGLASLAFTGLYLGLWILLCHPSGRDVREFAASPAPLWLLLVFLAYPMPFVLRWGGKGLLGALALLVGGFLLYAALIVYGRGIPGLAWVPAVEAWLRRTTLPPALGHGLTWGLPLLLGVSFYGLSCRILARRDA